MSRLFFARVAAIAALCPVAASYGHHSFSAEFDRDKPIQVTGTVTKVEWTNPHARIYLDVQGADGKVVNWDFELGPPNGLMRQGWRRDSLHEGHVVTINGFLSKDQEHVANARSVHLPDGRQVLAGSSFDVDSATAAP
ncbi:MAG TPA: DUF6152 family protein [Gammaproteobacteria bacterium]|nr:DUF6152 family protein [Gammaproteobacteria bacterium]